MKRITDYPEYQIKEICEKYYIELRCIMDNDIETDEKFNSLPNVVNRWKKLIAYIEKTNF